jgi:hypothetical protein
MSNERVMVHQPTVGEVHGDGNEAHYCTVDDPVTGAGLGYVQLPENGRVVTAFNQICTDFTQRVIGDEYQIEAYTSQIAQLAGLVRASDVNNDLQIRHTLFLQGTVRMTGNVPTGTAIFQSPWIPVARVCGVTTYDLNSPGFVRTLTGHEALSQADVIGLISFSWFNGVPC